MNLNYQLLEELSKLYGDSFYLLSTKQFTDNYDALLDAFRSYYPNTAIAYSYKTNYTPLLCLLVDQKGGYAEVVSEMEYDLAIKIGVDPQRIIVNGPYKERRALEKYLLNGSTVHLDSLHEVGLTMELAQCHRQAEFLVSIRCNFQISDGYTSRFGIDVDSNDFIQSIEDLRSVPNIRFRGLHCHFPDRNLDSFKVRMDKMLDLLGKSFPEGLEYLDLGGGYFGKMTQELEAQFSCTVPDYSDYAWEIAGRFSQFVAQQNWGKRPQLIIEPGTAIVADVMKFVARIIAIKNISGKKIAMSTGSKFNLGSFSSPLNMPMNVFSKKTESRIPNEGQTIDVSGYTCIESDYLYKKYKGSLSVGDFTVFDNVGSYSVVFKPPFIMPNVAVIEIDEEGKTKSLIKRKEENEDLFRTYTF